MKQRLLRIASLVYMGIILFCLVLVVKPGLSIFYYKEALQTDSIKPVGWYGYRYPLQARWYLSPLEGILVDEDGHLLKRSNRSAVIRMGKGAYDLGGSGQDALYVYFASTDGNDPRINGSSYTLYYPVLFFSRPIGVVCLLVLLSGLAIYLFLALRRQENRQKLIPAFKLLWAEVTINMGYWKRLFTFTVIAAYLFTFLEWLFFVTMPSFMDMMSLAEKLAILILTGLVVTIIGVLALIIGIVIDMILLYLKLPRRFVFVGVLVPAGILAGLSLLLFDNFTYTLFKFGVVSTDGLWRGVYGLAFIILLGYIAYKLLLYTGLAGKTTHGWPVSPRLFYLAGALLLVSVVVAIGTHQKPVNSTAEVSVNGAGQNLRRPNILLLGGDGLSARSISVYGYERETTPRLLALSHTSLVAENAFNNVGQSAGSIVSMFTSKLPTETRVIYPPDILTGDNAFQHLPGILKSRGYLTVQMAISRYIDADTVNLQNGFDIINQQSVESSVVFRFVRQLGFSDVAYFTTQLAQRLGDRLGHIFYLRAMENSFDAVTEPTEVSSRKDRMKVNEIINLLTKSRQPVFVHAHLLVTHGPVFYPRQWKFAQGQYQTEAWMTDFYDDAVYDFDLYVGQIIDALTEAGALNNTIVIIYSDHGQQYTINERIPLIIHFPNNEYTGELQANVQNLDIAPTILDYLDLAVPEWMDGQSLLRGELDPHRLIFGLGVRNAFKSLGQGAYVLDSARIAPPFYQFGEISVIDCQKWYQLDLVTYQWSSGIISGSTALCAEDSLHTLEQIQSIVIDQLANNGFDVASLKK